MPTYTISQLLINARDIWGNDRMRLDQIVVRLMVGVGDLARVARDRNPSIDNWNSEVKKELGNLIFSAIRWCDDLGFTPEECIDAAMVTQRRFAMSGRTR